MYGIPAYFIGEGLAVQPAATALRTGNPAHESPGLVALFAGVALLVLAPYMVPEPLKGVLVGYTFVAEIIADIKFAAFAAVKKHMQPFFAQFVQGCAEIGPVHFENGENLLEEETSAWLAQKTDGTFVYTHPAVRYNQLRIDIVTVTQTAAGFAGTVGRVEGKQIGCRIFVGQPRFGIEQFHRVELVFARILNMQNHVAVGHLQGCIYTLGDACAAVFTHHEPVDHHIYVVRFIAVYLHAALQFLELPVHAHTNVSLFKGLVEQLAVMALTPANHRGHAIRFGTLRQIHDALHHLVGCLPGHLVARLPGIGLAYPCIQQAQVIIDFGNRTHCRPRVAVGGLLVDGDHRRQAVDKVDLGPLHHPQELPRIRRKGFHEPALPLGIDGIEGQ